MSNAVSSFLAQAPAPLPPLHARSPQSTYMSAGSVGEDSVYTTAGKPLPRDIQNCAEWLLNEPLSTTYASERGCLCVRPHFTSPCEHGEVKCASLQLGTPVLMRKCCLIDQDRAISPPCPPRAGILDLQLQRGIALVDILQQLQP